jgi:hypothetical protein
MHYTYCTREYSIIIYSICSYCYSFPVIAWCSGEVLDTTTAAVASKLNPVSPPSSSVNSTTDQSASKAASATVSVLSQSLGSGPVKEQV